MYICISRQGLFNQWCFKIKSESVDVILHMAFSTSRAASIYPKRRLSVRSRKVSTPRDLYLESSDRSEIWQALRQQCCRCACQISKRYDNLKNQSRGFETLRDLTKRRLFGYWDGALVAFLQAVRPHPSGGLLTCIFDYVRSVLQHCTEVDRPSSWCRCWPRRRFPLLNKSCLNLSVSLSHPDDILQCP